MTVKARPRRIGENFSVATLVVVSGLPGTGKTTIADAIERNITSPIFNKDHIEASLWRTGVTATSAPEELRDFEREVE